MKRYDPEIISYEIGDFPEMRAADDGDYVLYTDHLAEIERREKIGIAEGMRRAAEMSRTRGQWYADGGVSSKAIALSNLAIEIETTDLKSAADAVKEGK